MALPKKPIHVTAQNVDRITTAIFEDEPGWDPGTMGNKKGFRDDGTWVDNSGGGQGPPDSAASGQPIIW